jgi:hypothetical protein
VSFLNITVLNDECHAEIALNEGTTADLMVDRGEGATVKWWAG